MFSLLALAAGSVLAQEKPAESNTPPFHVIPKYDCRITWELSQHRLPRGWETLDPVKVRDFLNACLRHDPERRLAGITHTASVFNGQLFFYGDTWQQEAVAELFTALGGYDCDGFEETKPTQILWPVPLTIPAAGRPSYSLAADRLKVEQLLDEDLGSVVKLESVAKILSYRKNQQPLTIEVHPTLEQKPSASVISGTNITLRSCLESYARGIGGRLAVRGGTVLIEPAPKTKREDWPIHGAVVRRYPLRLPSGVTTADVERLLTDLVAFLDGKDTAVLVLPDRVVALTSDTFESHPRIAELLEKLEEMR